MMSSNQRKRNQDDDEDDVSSPKRLRGGGGGGYGGGDDDGGGEFDDFADDFDDVEYDLDGPPPPQLDEDDDEGDITFGDITEAHRARWSRPVVPAAVWDVSAHDLNLQWLDIDMIGGKPLVTNPNATKKVLGAADGTVPIIRLYGVNETGNSVAVFIHGFTAYAYFALPRGYSLDGSDENLGKVRSMLDEMLRSKLGSQFDSGKGGSNSNTLSDGGEGPKAVLGVQNVTNKQSIMGYDPSHTAFLKVYVAMPGMIPKLKTIMEDGIRLPGITNTASGQEVRENIVYQPFECNVPYVLRYMIDRDITGASWLSLPKGTYKLRQTEGEKGTHCQIEADIFFNEIIPRKPEGEWSKVAPLRILSFDIECQGRKGYFPEAEHDPVIQIANTVSVYGETKPIVQNVFTLKGCLPIVGAQVISSTTEEDMLLKWRTFVHASDADIFTGYNVQNFDIPYLLDRAEALWSKKDPKLRIFTQWGRVKNAQTRKREQMFQSSAYGRRTNTETTIEGRVIFDMLPYMQRNHKLSSYSLNSVCAEYLGQQK
jgi:DNA polymerase delta subunit 1